MSQTKLSTPGDAAAAQPAALLITGYAGLFAALFTGCGEFLLHFDADARYAQGYAFFQGIASARTTAGHFLAVAAAPLYIAGCWHIRLMLQPASGRWSLAAFLIGAYGFAVGAVWIGSRAAASALVNMETAAQAEPLLALYDFHYETLLQVIRLAILLLSFIYIALVATGRSRYPRWAAWLNPLLLTILSFVVYLVLPALGKYLMPIALNVGFAIFFAFSLYFATHQKA